MSKATQIKQMQRHTRNESWKSYMQVLRKLGIEQTLHELPQEAQRIFKRARLGGVRLDALPGSGMHKVVEAARADFRSMLNTEMLEVPTTGQKFSISEILIELYSCVLVTPLFLDLMIEEPLGGKFEDAFEKWFSTIVDIADWVKEFSAGAGSPFATMLDQISGEINMCDRGYYWFARRHLPPTGFTMQRVYMLHCQVPQTARVTIDGRVRTVFRLAETMAIAGLQWCSIQARVLGIENDGEFPVYVQQHALVRARERLAPLRRTTIDRLFSDACKQPEIVKIGNQRFFLTIRYDGCKVGYLVLELHEENLVAKTFLFVTQSGCPEGEALNNRFGMRAYEKQYLGLDRLSTFMSTDILHDKALSTMLTDCGCAELVKLKGHAVIETRYAHNLRKTLCLDQCEEMADEFGDDSLTGDQKNPLQLATDSDIPLPESLEKVRSLFRESVPG